MKYYFRKPKFSDSMNPKKILIVLIAVIGLSSHDMFLKLDQYFLTPNSKVIIQLFNGTFNRSENVIERDRMQDVSVVTNGVRNHPESGAWFEENNVTFLNLKTSDAGTVTIGVSTLPRTIEMTGTDFNDYLKHDGILDMLEERKKTGMLDSSAKELYSKHVKTIVQVGDSLSEDWSVNLGYPIEFIPLQNPYDTEVGQSLRVQLLRQQKPLANQLVYIGKESYAPKHTNDGHIHTPSDKEGVSETNLIQIRTDEKGIISIPIDVEGIWHLKTIHLVTVDSPDLTHESNWATLTFAIGKGLSGQKEHQHTTHQDNQNAILYIIISVLLIASLFLFFNRKNVKVE